MNDAIKESTPMITPDGLRKINMMNKAFYETHTKKNFGRSDTYGSQYSGTVENFGFEMLLEARKQKMEKPSLEGVFKINNYKYYFDLQYSNMIETYEQQGMLEAVLKKDVFLSNKEYRLKFSNCEDVYIPRSESWGCLNDSTESKVFKNKFIHTKTAPKLLIKDLSTDITEEIDLKLEVAEDFEADYYFYHEFSTDKFIDTYDNGELITVPITNEDAELPFVWICEEILESLPPVDLVGNEPIDGNPILTIGVDGHDVSHIYPIIYGMGSFPAQETQGEWFLKAFSELDGFDSTTDNHNSKISSIYYSFRPDIGDDIDYEISFEEEYIKITLSDVVDWNIVKDTSSSEYHAEISFDAFYDNTLNDQNVILKQAFDIGFSDNYLYIPYEGLCEGAESGIHVDILSDYSENSVPKKNGVIHSLGDFDGLPSYLKSFHDDSIHRSRIELYTIRDRLNRYTQTATGKQTAGLILDSGLSHHDSEDYDSNIARVYYVNNDKISYVNNSSISDDYKKSPLTIARICDIPTQYEQLMHINNVAATYLFDQRYVRSETGMTNVDKDLLLNKRRFGIVMTKNNDNSDVWLYDYRSGLPTKQDLIDNGYVKTVNIENTNIPITSNNFNVLVGGSGYSVGDKFYCLVGGKAFDGTVSSVTVEGSVNTVTVDVNADDTVSYYNINGNDTPLKTVTVDSENGNGKLQIVLNTTQSERYPHTPMITTVISPSPSEYNLLAFMNDQYGNIFMYELQLDWTWVQVCQVEGDEFRNNPYDSADISMQVRTFDYAFFKHILSDPLYADDNMNIFYNPSTYITQSTINDYQPAAGHKGESSTTDLSEYIILQNMPDSYYALDCYDDSDNGHFNLHMYNGKSPDGYETILPRFNTNNTLEHFNVTNRLERMNSSVLNKSQPTLFVYFPTYNKRITETYSHQLNDTILSASSRLTSYQDYCQPVVSPSGSLKWNVYYYPEYEFSDDYNERVNQLKTMKRSDLITYIRNTYGSNSEPFKYEDTEYKYSFDDLINYIMERYPTDGPYLKSGLRVHAHAGEYINNVSKQPTGGMLPVTAEIIDVDVTANGKKELSEPLNIFIIDDKSFSGFEDNFKVIDEYGNDITSTAVVIWNNFKYIYRDNTWIQLEKNSNS